ncbi:Minor extracellular protease vpr [Cytospora mali]|uniref:Minor extracellular protease vpr n=1 Tax=Cytospora mali TaxID=578113 RepID=A0A194UX37_CYTMA|nr:Minor extracellular protease vpr [Valsa mali var. pyri (nom. inval.)]
MGTMAMAMVKFIVSLLGIIGLARAKPGPGLTIPGAFIMEFEEGVDIDSHLSSVQHMASTRMKLDHKLFKGASIRFHDVDKAQDQAGLLASTPHVKQIWPVQILNMPEHTVHWNAGEDATTMESHDVRKPRQVPADTFSPHVMTQVNRLRDAGFMGEGIKVAVIDTGVDYRHPALGGCFGPGCLVSFGYDFVGNAYNGTDTPVPDPDPLDCDGHGTHVAGIIAAQTNNPFGIIGAATGVTLGAYRVFGCDGSTSNDVLIAAFNMAYENGADIITASIGDLSGWSEDPSSVAVSRIVENGVPCTLSAGNRGHQGFFSTSSAANGKRATSVASIENIVIPNLLSNALYTVQGGPEIPFAFEPGQPDAWENVTLPLWAVSFNTTDPENACAALPDDTPDLSAFIVLVRRGTCTFQEKLENVVAKGAKYVVVYNNQPTDMVVEVSVNNLSGLEATAMVTAYQGATWIDSLSAGQNVTVTMTDPQTSSKVLVSPLNNLTGGYAAVGTSWGPTYEVDLKPQLAAPGGNILSTYPTHLGSYAVLSGTSMATPLVAAIYALLMTIRGTKDPRILENLLSSTSNPKFFNNGSNTYPILAPVVQQGSGIVQAHDAAYATSLLSVSSLSFNDTDNIEPVQNFTISNTGNQSVMYAVSNMGAATGYTLPSNGSIFPAKFPNFGLLDDYATMEFSNGGSITIPAGEHKVVSVRLTPPAGLDARRLPVYSGYIAINGSDGSSLSLPYLGVAGSLHSAKILDPSGTYMINSQAADRPFMLPPPGRSNDTQYSGNATVIPKFLVRIAFGSALIRVDAVPVNISLGTNVTESLGLKTLGDVFTTPLTYQPRGDVDINWYGQLANGNYAPAGTYRLVIRALKIFGDRENADDYETIEMPEFTIQYVDSASTSAKLRRRKMGWTA